MGTNYFSGTPVDEGALEIVAQIIGPRSAAAQALAEAARRRATGEDVAIYQGHKRDSGTLFVGPRVPI